MDQSPNEIVQQLIDFHGKDEALNVAIRRAQEAQTDGRLYELSIWREVKKLIRELPDELPA